MIPDVGSSVAVITVVAVVIALVVVGGAVALVYALVRGLGGVGGGAGGGGVALGPAVMPWPVVDGPKMPAAQAWQAAIPSMRALGLTMLDAECYTRDYGQDTLFVKLHTGSSTLQAWVKRAYPGGVLEQYLGKGSGSLHPGATAQSELARFAVEVAGQAFTTLPPAAQLTVTAPAIPGDAYEIELTTPLTAPRHVEAAVRVVQALEAASHRGAPEGAHAELPRVAILWQEAAASLHALRLTKLDAECFTGDVAGATLFVKLEVSGERVRAWIDRASPGGVLERYLGKTADLAPGEQGGTDLARSLAELVREPLSSLPPAARLRVTAPQIPGDRHSISLTTPFTANDQPSMVARVVLFLDEAARRRAPEGDHAELSPAAVLWQEAASSLHAMGMQRLDAQCYTRDVERATLFLKLEVPSARVRAWVERAWPGGVLERFLGQRAEMGPGEQPRTELARFVAEVAGEALARLPAGARVSVKAPEIAGDTYEVTVTSPFVVGEVAGLVVWVVGRVDEVGRGRAGR